MQSTIHSGTKVISQGHVMRLIKKKEREKASINFSIDEFYQILNVVERLTCPT